MNKGRTKKAFTLVELLVVIAIIALLIAILAPSLKAAKDLAKATYCMANQNALVKSALVYAEGNRGYMMVFGHHITLTYIDAPNNTYQSYVCFGGGSGIDPKTGLFADIRGLGRVYAAGLLGPAEMFYCPGQKDRRMRLDHYPKPWGSALGDGSGFIRNSYMWDPWVKQNPGDTTRWTYEDALMVGRHPNARCLTCDLIDDHGDVSHTTSNSARWNLAYMDSHVEPFENKTLYNKFFPGGPATGLDVSGDWVLFNEDPEGVRPHLPGDKIQQ